MKKEKYLLKILFLLVVFSLNINANTKTNTDGKAGATMKVDAKAGATIKKVDTIAGPSVSQIDKWRTLINLEDYVFKNKKIEKKTLT